MTTIDFATKPVKLIMENNIISDIVYEDSKIYEKLDKISEKISNSSDPRDFLLVVLDKGKDSIKGIITSEKLKEMLEQLKTNHELTFGNFIRKPFTILNTDPISKALNLFESGRENIILVTDKNSKYLGKLKRTNLNKKLDELINSFRS